MGLNRPTPYGLIRAAAALGLLAMSSCAAPPEAVGGRAAIVVVHGDGTIATDCVAFEGETLNGAELLRRSRFSSSVDAANPLGTLVCAIDGEGCSFPQDSCLCQCRGPGGCSYWAYFNLDPDGGWTYAVQGARLRALKGGDVDAWVWLDRSLPGGELPLPPGDVNFPSVCD